MLSFEKIFSRQTAVSKEEQASAVLPRRRLGSKSRIGAVVLLVLSLILLVVAYRVPNIVVEVDSVVAFAAAIVLIYKDASHSVQLRVVDRILDSSKAQLLQLASFKFPSQTGYIHQPRGERVTDVVVVPSSSGLENEQPPDGDQTVLVELVPPGRSLAQLFLREVGKDNPTLEDIVGAMQPIFSDNLGLSLASSMKVTSDNVSVLILQPVLKSPCAESQGSQVNYSLACVVCSLLAVLVCFTSKRSVSVKSCSHDANQNVTSIDYHLEPEPEKQESKEK